MHKEYALWQDSLVDRRRLVLLNLHISQNRNDFEWATGPGLRGAREIPIRHVTRKPKSGLPNTIFKHPIT
jgi:hypothetical protein